MNKGKKRFNLFLLLWFGRLITTLGTGISSFCLSIFVFNKTGRVTDTSLILLVAFLPELLLTVPAGVLSDRVDRRKLMILGHLLSTIGLVLLIYFTDTANVEMTFILLIIGISAVFASIIDPAYKASVSDLLNKDDYSKATGLVQLASSAQFLIAPIIAGFLMKYASIRFALILDILTIIPTVIITLIVSNRMKRNGLCREDVSDKESTRFFSDLIEGIKKLKENKVVLNLVIISFFITLLIGGIQALFSPLILSFSTSEVLGLMTSISACGMLVTSLILGVVPIKKKFARILGYSLACTGFFMIGFGFTENIFIITTFGVLIFATLPFANMSLDVLVRTNIDEGFEGRIWSLVGLISQLGFIVSFSLVGILSDKVFIPMLLENGLLANSIGKIIGTGPSRGIGLFIIASGLCLVPFALIIANSKTEEREVKHEFGLC